MNLEFPAARPRILSLVLLLLLAGPGSAPAQVVDDTSAAGAVEAEEGRESEVAEVGETRLGRDPVVSGSCRPDPAPSTASPDRCTEQPLRGASRRSFHSP